MPAKRPPATAKSIDRHVGRRLGRRRRELCLTLDELAQRSGVASGTIIEYEKGTKTVSAAALLALANTLGVSVAWFFADPPPGGAGEPGAAPAPESVAEAERFLAAFVRIADPKLRRDILGLVKAAAAE